jgi:hypothetical protein
MNSPEAQLLNFVNKAVTRSGVPFVITSVQKDGQGMVNTLKGTVSVNGQNQPMLWNVVGRAFASNTTEFDLVEEIPFEDFQSQAGGGTENQTEEE